MGTTAANRVDFAPSTHQDTYERLEDRFELINAAGMGFFGIVFYAILKSDFLAEQSRLASDRLKYDSAGGLKKVQAVKICNPLCPSGIKASAGYIIKDITAMKKIWAGMEEHVQHNFARLLSYSISKTPWYSMEPVMSGLTLEKLYLTSKAKQLPIPEELAFHMVDQVTKACLFLHEKCTIVRADTNRENFMLRYPGRHTASMPDVVFVDWSLWEQANPERIARDMESVYESLFPVLFEGGWGCKMRHDEQGCLMYNVIHSPKWLHLCNALSASQPPTLLDLQKDIAGAADQSRDRIEAENRRADAIRALLDATKEPFTEESLRTALDIDLLTNSSKL